MGKGVSLAIDTVIIMIIAVIILAALIGLIAHFVLGGQQDLEKKQAAMDACETFKSNYNCQVGAYFTGTVKGACEEAGYVVCVTGSDAACISACCGVYCS